MVPQHNVADGPKPGNQSLAHHGKILPDYAQRLAIPIAVASFSARESLIVMHMSAQGEVLDAWIHGSPNSASLIFPLRRIVREVLELETERLVIGHNHPSGNARPSRTDISQTRTLERILTSLNVRLVDHFIVSRTDFFSFRGAGLL